MFVNQTRTILSVAHNKLLTLERSSVSVVLIEKKQEEEISDSDPLSNWTKRSLVRVADNETLNSWTCHGMAISNR